MVDNIDDRFNSLLNKVSKIENKKNESCSIRNKTIEDKQKILLPIANFMHKITDAGFMVHPFQYLLQPLTKRQMMPSVPFKFFISDTDENIRYDLIHPSPLIVINDPIRIEIGVINETFRDDFGLINISCGRNHPDFEIFKRRFDSYSQAIDSISEFLEKNTVSIERN